MIRLIGSVLAETLLLVFLILTFSGCKTSQQAGFPKQSYDEKKQIKELEEAFPQGGIITNYYAHDDWSDEKRRQERNQIIDGRLALINLHYNQFVAQAVGTRQNFDTFVDLTELGLNLATTAVGGAEAKTIFGAISAGVTGTKLTIDKNYFYEKTMPVLIGAMNAARAKALTVIYQGMIKSAAEYTLAQALSDLDKYYFAGTFLGALQDIQADSGEKQKKAEDKSERLRTFVFTKDDTSKALTDFVAPGGDLNADNVAALRKWIDNAANVPDEETRKMPIQVFINHPDLKALREKAVKALIPQQ